MYLWGGSIIVWLLIHHNGPAHSSVFLPSIVYEVRQRSGLFDYYWVCVNNTRGGIFFDLEKVRIGIGDNLDCVYRFEVGRQDWGL